MMVAVHLLQMLNTIRRYREHFLFKDCTILLGDLRFRMQDK